MTRIVLADANELVREGIAALLNSLSGHHVVGQASDGRSAVRIAEELRPDVAVIDSSLPELNSIDTARGISRSRPRARVILMTSYPDEIAMTEMIDAGVTGCVLKRGTVGDLAKAVRLSSRTRFFTGDLATALVCTHRVKGPHDDLTYREREILQLIGEGNSSKQIAAKLNIAAATVKTHRDNLMDKLEVREVAGLTRASIRLKLVSAEFREYS